MDSVTEVPRVNCLKTAKNCSGQPENPQPDSWDFKQVNPGPRSEMKRQLEEEVRKGTSMGFHEQY